MLKKATASDFRQLMKICQAGTAKLEAPLLKAMSVTSDIDQWSKEGRAAFFDAMCCLKYGGEQVREDARALFLKIGIPAADIERQMP